MPLLHRKPFVRQKPPPNLDPDEEVFLCKITHEIFRRYDEFFERTILCNSLVWSCALTGRAGLTYLEAVESERRARTNLQNFPEGLVKPLLLLVKQSQSKRLSELCEEVYGFSKERYFPGENVDVTTRGGTRVACQVVLVLSPHSSANGLLLSPHAKANGSTHRTEGDSIVISDEEELLTPKRGKPLSPSVFRYTVKPLNGETEAFTVKAAQLSRRKNLLSREKLKLLFKQHCEPYNGSIVLKPSSISKFGLLDLNFTQFFPDEPPVFSPASKSSPGQGALTQLKAMEEKLKLLQQKEDMVHQKTKQKKDKVKAEKRRLKEEKQRSEGRLTEEEHDRLKESVEMVREHLKKEEKQMKLQKTVQQRKEERRRKGEEKWNRVKEEQQRDHERLKLKEDLKRLREEQKEQQRAEKEKEREKLKEERRKYAERMKQMSKPTEDLECDDLKELPSPCAVQTRLPPHLFGEALMVLEFLMAFGEIFELKDEFPDGVTLEVLEEALVGSDPEGPLCELLFFFLSAIFQNLDEEQEQNPPDSDLSDPPDYSADSAASAPAAMMTTAAWAWSQQHQGRSLKQLDLDSCTLSEILRLKILSASAEDDPCVELRNMCPEILQRLKSTAVYDLQPGEKLHILNALVGKLLTLGLSRDLMEDCYDEQKAARQELREIRWEQHRRGREEAAYRVRMRKEERLREQEQKMKERVDKLREQENISLNGAAPEPTPDLKKPEQDKDVQKDSKPVALSPEELQKEQEKVCELLARLHRASSCTALLPLGKDRWFRKYWLLPSLSALFVEEDKFGLSADLTRPEGGTPEPVRSGPGSACYRDDEPREQDGVSTSSAPHSPDSTPAASDPSPCQPQSAPRWWFYSSVEQFEELLQSLNPRGHRESSLKEALLQYRAPITAALQTCEQSRYRHPEDQHFPECTAAESVMEVKLRDLLLDIEDRVHQGTLGSLKVAERHVWRAALEAGHYNTVIDSCKDQSMEDSSHSLGASPQSCSVRALAAALAQIERGIERRFLKPPLDSSDARVCRSLLERWRESLSCCSSLSQVFVHLSTLERSILWSRSLLNARCRICRRKGDADNMLLCDGCDRGHHTHCLRPRLKAIPKGDWFCPDCKPKQRSNRIPSRTRSSIDEEETEDSEDQDEEEDDDDEEEDDDDDEEEDDDDDDEEEDDEEEEEEEGEGEEESPPPSKKSSAPPPKGKNQSASSRSKQTTPKNTGSAAKPLSSSRSSGKKPSPPSAKAPPRAGSRSSARLSLEVTQNEKSTPKTTPKSTPKTSPQSNGPRGKQNQSSEPVPARTKPVLPSGLSSGSRRSSGRNQGVHELSACEHLTVELVRHQDSWPFMKLVSRTQVPDYYDIVKRPIALSTIREKVNNCQYHSTAEFMADVELMFSNCLQYNPLQSNEAKAGLRLQQHFHSELERVGLRAREGPAGTDRGLRDREGPAAKRPRH